MADTRFACPRLPAAIRSLRIGLAGFLPVGVFGVGLLLAIGAWGLLAGIVGGSILAGITAWLLVRAIAASIAAQWLAAAIVAAVIALYALSLA